ncbi:MAG TPA: MOSC N-terminal beta barrel domain-containing protein [Solirubrobacteraceae bacterium]|nr:MOSC N-terminal beta barrel domain-containing protein [Solirubrobacteraceae bacterium]
MPTVTGLAITPVKATRLHQVDRVTLTPEGVHENRRFYVIDERGRMVNSKMLGALQTVVADYSDTDRTLRLSLPDGRIVEGEVGLGEEIRTSFFSQMAGGRLVHGQWSEALSEVCGQPLRLVEADGRGTAVDRGIDGSVSLISRASLARLAEVGGLESIDPRRFRMLIEIDGVEANAEDGWVDHGAYRIGEAVVAFGGHVGRCMITSRDPDTAKVDLPTLDILGSYRTGLNTTEPLPFGIWGRVVHPGSVAVGDEVASVDR